MFTNPQARLLFAGFLSALAPLALGAQEGIDSRWALCPPVAVEAPPEPPPPGEEDVVRLSADEAISRGEALTSFTGDVLVTRMGTRLQADRVDYDKRIDLLEVSGNVRLRTPQMSLTGEQASMFLGEQRGEIRNGNFFVPGQHAFGAAERVVIEDPEHTHLEQVSYSTCSPEKQDWVLSARRLVLDESTNTGEAYNATLRFKGVPFVYLPYMNFPLAGRKSGFLLPTFGTSDTSGTDIGVPYYWNIAPNRDATITPRNLTGRGPMLMNEFRYLNPHSNGQLNYDFLQDDKLFGDDRSYGYLRHVTQFNAHWSGRLLYQEVSDSQYFDDLGNSQSSSSQTHLERHGEIYYRRNYWTLLGRAQDYQRLTGDEPYQRLPQLQLAFSPPSRPNQLRFDLSSELVNFTHDTEDPTGTRLDLYPGVSMPWEGAAWFLTPRVAVRHTQYELNKGDSNTDFESQRTLPVASLDSGLFFERDTSIFDRSAVQTLEPRLYYLYVPFDDQSEIPLFDTSEYDFTFGQLFRENRFTGADRMGDANQLTAALTTRLLDGGSGAELARASIGQIYYFRDREVTLNPEDPVQTEDSSDILGELALRPVQSVDLSAGVQWDPREEREDILSSRLRYHPSQDQVLSMSYRFRRDRDLRQTDLALYWPVTSHWQFLGRWNYDLEQERDLDVVAGLEYRSCCWAARLVKRGRLNTTTDELEHSIYMTLELKGLGSFGNPLEDELERGILGYY